MQKICLRVDGILLKYIETSEDVSDSVKNLFELVEVNIPDVVVGRAHTIGHIYKDSASNKNGKGIIVRFTTFRHRTMLYITTKNTVISPNFMVWKFCGKA